MLSWYSSDELAKYNKALLPKHKADYKRKCCEYMK